MVRRYLSAVCQRRWLAALALLLPSCAWDGNFNILGYTTRPNYDCEIKTVYVPIFENRTMWRDLEFDLTQAVVREIQAKTPFKVVSCPDKADTELLGTIIAVSKGVINRNQLNEVREAQEVLGVQVVWRDRRTGEILSRPPVEPPVPLQPGGVRPGSGGPTGSRAAASPMGTGLPGNPPPGWVPPQPPPVAAPTMPNGLPPGAAPAPPGPPPPLEAVPPGTPTPPGAPPLAEPLPPPVLIQAKGDFIPELGGTITTAAQEMVQNLAVQIVSMMEKPW